jgi:hypothetical protein
MFELQDRPPALQNIQVLHFSCLEEHFDLSGVKNPDPLTQLNPDFWQHCREDNELNLAKQPAVRKIGMLLNVMSQLKKVRVQNFWYL